MNFLLKKSPVEKYRLSIYELLKKEKLKDFGENERNFYFFLINDDFNITSTVLDIYIARDDFDIKFDKLKEIINIFRLKNNLISFKNLFKLDESWFLYYNTSADINGNINNSEKRYGINRKYVNDIMNIKTISKLNLDKSIEFYLELKIIINIRKHV